MTDDELHLKLSVMANDKEKFFELWPGEPFRPLPFFGWYWRKFDWNCVPLGYSHDGDIVGIMAKNKWYYPEYYCTEGESTVIKNQLSIIVYNGWTKERAKWLSDYIHEIGQKANWTLADRKAIDERTKKDFEEGRMVIMDQDGNQMPAKEYFEKLAKECK